MLARRDHSRAELKAKLLAKGFDSVDADIAVGYCESMGYLDDGRYAQMLLRSHINRGHGPAKVKQAFIQKGIPAEVSSAVMNDCDCDWYQLAHDKAQRKFGPSGKLEYKEKARRIRYLIFQGFSYVQVAHALEYDPYTDD
ncbi:MAG: recombination regulator RecX [Shewanella sp.]|nr:recombination regulator RecX [Shewanella sp.]MCF1459031.1 recombination regulator RecX [Shewanella sp.]